MDRLKFECAVPTCVALAFYKDSCFQRLYWTTSGLRSSEYSAIQEFDFDL